MPTSNLQIIIPSNQNAAPAHCCKKTGGNTAAVARRRTRRSGHEKRNKKPKTRAPSLHVQHMPTWH